MGHIETRYAREIKSYGEAESAPISEAGEEMQQIRAELAEYNIADIWHCWLVDISCFGPLQYSLQWRAL